MNIPVNVFAAMVLPLFLPWFYYLLGDVRTKPEIREKDGKYIIIENISIFHAQLPTAYIANCIWGMTININGISSDLVSNNNDHIHKHDTS